MNKKNKIDYSLIDFRQVTEKDTEFLYRVYASTREEEMAMTGWSVRQKEEFLRMQFNLQHTQYLENYKNASFDIVLLDKTEIGRLYVDRREKEMRLIDLSLLTAYRNLGIGGKLLENLIAEADKKKHVLSLHVLQNSPVIKLYERLGFKIIKEVGFHFFMEKPPASEKNNGSLV